MRNKPRLRNIGFISTRLAGTDGVSLETAKWAQVLEQMGYRCFYMAGELDRPGRCSMLVELAHFRQPEVRSIYEACFNKTIRPRDASIRVQSIKEELKDQIYKFISIFGIDMLIPQNALAIPLNIPLGLALTEVIAETGIPTVAHHHDFFWERKRFLLNAAWDYLNMAFPPHLSYIQHIVINSSARNQLSLRTGISSHIIPNVMDFDNPPPPSGLYTKDMRKALGIERGELFILQPTRVVQRKGIEHAIELLSRLKMKAKLVISHASGDEGYEYEQRVRQYSKLMNVDTLFVSDIIGEKRGKTKQGNKIFTLSDVYPYADLVTYASTMEGFGNAFLEAIYFRKPIIVNNYTIYSIDIKPRGFKVIEFDEFITDGVVDQTRQVLTDKELAKQMTEHNYRLGKQYYSFTMLRRKLETIIKNFVGS